MASCPTSQQLSAFHDGEVDETRRAEIEAHLRYCPACAAELKRLQTVSELFNTVPLNAGAMRLSQIGLHRLHRRMDQAMEEGFFRFVRVLNAIAACVLVAGSAWLLLKTRDSRAVEIATPAAPPWVDVAEVSDTSTGAYSTPAAAWYLADDSSRAADEAP
jgi:anti-sigma factor RsiW